MKRLKETEQGNLLLSGLDMRKVSFYLEVVLHIAQFDRLMLFLSLQ